MSYRRIAVFVFLTAYVARLSAGSEATISAAASAAVLLSLGDCLATPLSKERVFIEKSPFVPTTLQRIGTQKVEVLSRTS